MKNDCAFPETDWNEVWKQAVARRKKPQKDRLKHWNRRADTFARNVRHSSYIKSFLGICKTWPQATVLDIGAAAGTLALPLAGQVRKVTAIEPAARMREILADRCRKEGIDNIAIVDGSWESDWEAIEPHDIFIASRSMMVDDLHAALKKIRQYTKKQVYLSTIVGDGPFDRQIIEAAGRECLRGADYIILYNFLRRQGICANVDFTRHADPRVYNDLEHALREQEWMLPNMTEQEKEQLRQYLKAELLPTETGLVLPRHTVRWAVISWDVREF